MENHGILMLYEAKILSMKNLNTWKKFRAVLTAAICGAVLFDIIIGVSEWLTNLDDPGSQHGWCLTLLGAIFSVAALILAIPAAFVWSIFGIHGSSVLIPYAINGFNGAVIFAVVAVFWQFVVKGNGASRNRLLYFIFSFTLFSSTLCPI
jgi:hypothetical protein